MAQSVNHGVNLPPTGAAGSLVRSVPLRWRRRPVKHRRMKRSRELRPLSSEHQQALLIAFQLKKGLAGHPETAGAPKDLPGLLGLARRFDEQLFRTHACAEEELLGTWLTADDMARLRADHVELARLLEASRNARAVEQRAHLAAYADLLDRHVRWEERVLFPYAEENVDEANLARIGGELEKRLVVAKGGASRSARS